MIMRTIHHKPKAYFEPYMIMRTVHHTLIYASLILSVLITVNGQCSGSVQNLSVGYSTISVSPPGYPTGYTTNLKCAWLVTSSISGSTILLLVTDMTVNCAGVAINVYDDISTSGHQIHTNQCSLTAVTLGYQEATSGNVYFTFISDGDNTSPNYEKGFKMYLLSGNDLSGSGCSSTEQNLTASKTEQYLSSPGFPSTYDSNKNCKWTITASSSKANIFMQIEFLDVEHHASCDYDYLEITESGKTIAKLCRNDGWEPTEMYTSNGSSLSLRFHSDDITQKRGFLLSFIEIEQIDDWSGQVCSELETRVNYTEVCAVFGAFWCVTYENITEEYNVTVYFCCQGWTHNGDQNCSSPVCATSCRNGGTCVNPDTCACPAGYEGSVCQTLSLCSHLSPCYPGSCGGSPEQCACSTGFSGISCLQFTNTFSPTLHSSNSTIEYVDLSGNTVYTYTVHSQSTETVTWSNQNEYNRIELSIEASFDTNSSIGAIPSLPNYVREVRFGIVQAGVTFLYTEATGSSDFSVQCSGLTEPVEYLPCTIAFPLSPTFDVHSGDIFAITNRATSGGTRRLKNPDTNADTVSQSYNGHSVQNTLEFRFDFDVPTHCVQTSACPTNAMELEDDTTMFAIKPVWSGWSDALSGVYRYSFEVWKMEYDAVNDGLREPLITSSSNPVPDFITEVLSTDTSYPVFTPSEKGVYSCILEINDKANNSEYVRRIAVFDGKPEITINASNSLYVSTASSNTHYIWQTEYNLETPTTISVVWNGLFSNPSHVNGHFLTKILDYEPRLSDGIDRHNYKRILPIFNDNEGDRTVSSIPNIRGIVKYEMVHEIISKIKTEPPDYGWVDISPLAEFSSFTMASYTIGDGDSHQIWIRASDVVSGNKTETTIIHFDKTGPQSHLTNVLRNINGGTHQFTSRINAISQDLHSGVRNVTFQVVLNSTSEVRYRTVVIVTNETEEYCQQTPDCYCVPMGQCFIRTLSFDFDNCLLQVPQELVDTGLYSLHVTSFNTALLSTITVHNIGNVIQFSGINIYPSPSSATISNRTNTEITIEWTTPETCYHILQFVLYLHRPGNVSVMFNISRENRTMTLFGLSPGAGYTIDMYTEYGNETYVARSLTPLTVDFETASFCSHKQPCYPGHCLSYTDLCTCTNGFIGTSCLIFDAQYRPNILRYNATIKFDNFSTGETLYEYRSDRGYTNITWSNQPSFNNFDLQLDADFKYLEIFGAVPAFPNYVNNASFGIVEGRVQFTHIRSGSEVSNRKLVCQQATQRQPIQELRCQLNDYTVVDALSGDSFKFFFEARSGGFVELTRINDGSITGTEFYNGSLITGKVEFHFDFDVPVHCFDSSSCSDPPLVLLQDVTKNTVRPFWVGWSDRISSIYRYTFEVWKLQYNETTNKLHEPLITTTSNPVPLYIIQVLPGNISYPEFTPSEPGMYSCILEINDHANNSEYIRRVVLYDPLSEIEVNQSNAIVVTSANPLTNYQWITNYTLLSNYDVYLQWKNLFRNKQHEDEHYLAEIETFEPRLSDNIYRHNYKRILSRFDDNEGNRTKHAVDNINGIVKFQYNYEIVNRPSTIVPVSGWITLKPINDSTVISMVTGSIGDGDTQQIWIRAFDIFNASKTETVVVRYDKSEPVTFLSNVEFNVPSDESEFRSRFTLESEDLHSGVVNVDVSIVLNETGEVKLSKMFHVQNLTETECVAILDCYCIPMGKCFMRPIILEINNCDLALHLDRIKDGTYLLNVTSVNMATLQTSTILQVGDVQNFRGISKYPSPQLVSVMNKTNSQVTIQWVDTPTCYPKSNYVIILHHANNETEHFQVNKELNSFIVTGLAPGSAYKADLYTDYLFEGLLIQSPEPLTISFSTESYCSHLMPCYPGSCKADVDECICRNGFFGNSCLEFDNQYKPILMSGSAKIAYVNTTLSKEVFSYTTNATREGNITWTNQAEYNVINFNIEASFDGFGTFGLLQNYPSYISNVSFGVVEGGFEIYHLRDSTALSHSTIECTDATNDNPVQFLSCQAQYEDMMYFESGDIFQIVISVRSGGNRKLVNLANGNNEGTQYYTGISTKHLLEFRFDFDVPLHCSLTSSCEDSPLKLNQDVTKTSISPYWSAWTDVLSGVHRFSLEIWKLEYVESEDGFREPLKNASQNPVPLFIYETLAENTMFPQFVFTEPGLYSCILEVNDRANNSEYVRRIVLYDSTSDVSVNSSSGIIVSSALSETDYSWQTDFDPKDVTTLQMSWSYLFYNFFHTQEHLLSKVLDYEPRLSDGGRRQNYKRIRSHFDDLEGNRTINALPNVNGITRYYFARKVVSRQTPDVPETGWSLVTPISDNISLKIDALTLGDGSTLQIWVRAFDILNNSQWQSTLVHFDHSAPNIFVNQPQYNVNGEFSFTSRFTFVTQDLHSGCVNTSIKLVLKDTGDVRYETNNTVLNETQTDCSKSSDCYCVPMGLCFRRTQTFDVNTCLLGVPLKLIDQGKYTLEISSYNSATLLSQVSTEIDVNDIVGVNQYPGPLEVSFLNKTKTAVILKWTATPTCYHVARYVVYLYTPNNATRELEILPNITEVTIMDLLPGVTYSIEMFAVYQEFGNESNVIRSLDSFTVDFETSEADQTTESSGRNFVPIIFGSVVGFIVLVILVIICIVWFLKRRHRNLCVGPISEPDIVNDASKRPIMKQTSTLSRKLLNTRNVLSVPQTPSLEKADTNLKTNIFDINLPKGRAHTLPPLPPLSSVMKQNHK